MYDLEFMVSFPFSQHDFVLKQMDEVHLHSVGCPYGAISWHSTFASEDIPICSVTILGWPDLQVLTIPMLQRSLMEENLKNTQGQQQEVGIFMASVIHSQLLRQEFPTVCMRDMQYLQCQAAEIFIQILAQCSQSVL